MVKTNVFVRLQKNICFHILGNWGLWERWFALQNVYFQKCQWENAMQNLSCHAKKGFADIMRKVWTKLIYFGFLHWLFWKYTFCITNQRFPYPSFTSPNAMVAEIKLLFSYKIRKTVDTMPADLLFFIRGERAHAIQLGCASDAVHAELPLCASYAVHTHAMT